MVSDVQQDSFTFYMVVYVGYTLKRALLSLAKGYRAIAADTTQFYYSFIQFSYY